MQRKTLLHLGGLCALSLVVMVGLGTIGHLRQLTDPSDIVLQDGLLLVLMVGLNLEWLHVPVFLRSDLAMRRQLEINAVPLVIMGLTGVALGEVSRVQLQPFVMAVPLAILIAACAAGYEEYFFRGLVVALMLRLMPRHLLAAVVGSSLIFGLFHLVNWLHQPLRLTLLQMGSAWALGLLLTAIYLRTRGLLWPIVIHFAHDVTVMLLTGLAQDNRPTASIPLGIGLAVINLITALVLLRPTQRAGMAWPIQRAQHGPR